MSVEIDRSKYGYVYKITNLINGKTYVGQRKIVRDKTWDDYYGSGKLIQQAIAKYGKENFLKELISYADSQEELLELENSAINEFKLEGACEYNLVIYTPSPDNHVNASPEKKKLWYNNLSKSLRETFSADTYISYKTKDFEKRYQEFLIKHKVEDILSFYKEHKHILNTAKEFSTSYGIINKILEENNIEKINRTNVGYSRSKQERLNISNKARERLGLDLINDFKECSVCSKMLEPNNKSFLCLEHYKKQNSSIPDDKKSELIEFLEQKKSIREINRLTGVSKPKIRKFMIDNGYEIPKQSADAARKVLSDKYSIEAYVIDCLKCGESFRSKKSKERKFCSNDCYNEYRKS